MIEWFISNNPKKDFKKLDCVCDMNKKDVLFCLLCLLCLFVSNIAAKPAIKSDAACMRTSIFPPSPPRFSRV